MIQPLNLTIRDAVIRGFSGPAFQRQVAVELLTIRDAVMRGFSSASSQLASLSEAR
jgi:hypothetical protein